MHAAFTRSPEHGLSMFFLAKTLRMVGVDSLHVGTGVGKMHGGPAEVRENGKVLVETNYRPAEEFSSIRFEQDFGTIRSVLPVASGGVYPRLVPEILKIFGRDVQIQAGGGVHGHPSGTVAGAEAMLKAIEAAVEGVSLEEKARESAALSESLERW